MRLASFLILFLLASKIPAQTNSVLEYGQGTGEKLSWQYYQLTDHPSGYQEAFTYCGISYTVKSNEAGLSCHYKAFVDVQESWVNRNSKTDALLLHEQGLFDLTEVYARRMSKFTMEYIRSEGPNMTYNSLLQEVRKIYKEQNNLLFLEQQRYNTETRNGKDTEAQDNWSTKIRSQLVTLEKYKSS